MTPWILIPILVLVVLAMTTEVPVAPEDDSDEPVRHLHKWSKNVITDHLECLECNQKAGDDGEH